MLPPSIGQPEDDAAGGRARSPCRRLVSSRRQAAAWVLVGTFVGLGGCRPEPPPPGTLRLVIQSPPEDLDPRFATSAVAVRLSHLVFAPLFEIGDDLKPAPVLAARLERTDNVTYEVTLQDGALFHDGTLVTAEDVVFTYLGLGHEDVRSPHAPKFSRLLDVHAVDARTVRFVLKEPFAAFPLELCALGIVPSSCKARTAACRDAPVGAGPYRVVRFDPAAETLALQAHEGFLGGPPAIEHVEVRVVRDGTTRLLELIDGKADLVVGDLAPTDLDVVARYPRLVSQQSPGLGYTYLAMNLRAPEEGEDDAEATRTRRALSEPSVRRALALALDPQRILETKLRGAAQRATGMLPPGHWAKDPALQPLPHDPGQARRLLDEAGFPEREEGGRFRVVLATTTDRLRRSIALLLRHQLTQVGIDVQIRVGEWATLYEDIKRGSFELFSAKWTPVVEPDLMHWVFHSSSIPGLGKAGGNRGAYVDEELDAWLDEGRRLLDPEARKAPYQRAERRLLEALPYVPLWFEDELAVHQRALEGFDLRRTGSLLPIARARLAREAR